MVRGVTRALGAERVHPKCALIEQSGRGNNWAMGFHGNGADSVADENAAAEKELADQTRSRSHTSVGAPDGALSGAGTSCAGRRC